MRAPLRRHRRPHLSAAQTAASSAGASCPDLRVRTVELVVCGVVLESDPVAFAHRRCGSELLPCGRVFAAPVNARVVPLSIKSTTNPAPSAGRAAGVGDGQRSSQRSGRTRSVSPAGVVPLAIVVTIWLSHVDAQGCARRLLRLRVPAAAWAGRPRQGRRRLPKLRRSNPGCSCSP